MTSKLSGDSAALPLPARPPVRRQAMNAMDPPPPGTPFASPKAHDSHTLISSPSTIKPLLDIEVVRAFIRSKLGQPKSSHGGNIGPLSSGVFGIGTMGTSSLEGGYVPLSSHTHEQPHHPHHQGRLMPSAHQTGDEPQHRRHHHQDDTGIGRAPAALLDIEDVRDFVNAFLHHSRIRRRPSTSWKNKMPWHVPRAPFLAKGLQWPPENFASEEERRELYRKARKRKPFLMGSPPLWTVTAFNLIFFQILMYNPVKKFFDFLRKLP